MRSKAQQGFTLVEFAFVAVFGVLYFLLSWGLFTGIFVTSERQMELREFLDTGFLSMKVRYQEHLRSTGYCFTSNPPDYTFSDLQTSYQLMPNNTSRWFDVAGAVFRIDPNPSTGVVEQYEIIIRRPVGDDELEGYEVYPYYKGQTTLGNGQVEYRYSQPYEVNAGYRTAYSTTSSMCVS